MTPEEQPGIKLPMFTELYERGKERRIWINPAAVSHVTDDGFGKGQSLISTTSGTTLRLSEGVTYVVLMLQSGRTNVLPPCIYCSDDDHWSQDCPTMQTAAAGLDEYGDDDVARATGGVQTSAANP